MAPGPQPQSRRLGAPRSPPAGGRRGGGAAGGEIPKQIGHADRETERRRGPGSKTGRGKQEGPRASPERAPPAPTGATTRPGGAADNRAADGGGARTPPGTSRAAAQRAGARRAGGAAAQAPPLPPGRFNAPRRKAGPPQQLERPVQPDRQARGAPGCDRRCPSRANRATQLPEARAGPQGSRTSGRGPCAARPRSVSAWAAVALLAYGAALRTCAGQRNSAARDAPSLLDTRTLFRQP